MSLDNSDFWIRFLPWCLVVGTCATAAVWDVRSRRIPNWLTASALATGFLLAGYSNGLAGVCGALLSACILALPYIVLFAVAGGGAGDAKLMAAVGALLGLKYGILALLGVSICGMVLGIGTALIRGRCREMLINLRGMSTASLSLINGHTQLGTPGLFPPPDRMQPLPYALAILCGVCLTAGGVWLCGL